jgi:hypothetical protein
MMIVFIQFSIFYLTGTYAFLAAFGNKDITLVRLHSANTNSPTGLPLGVFKRNRYPYCSVSYRAVGATLLALSNKQTTFHAKIKFILATDGQTLEAENLTNGETNACDYTGFPNHFDFLLPLAEIYFYLIGKRKFETIRLTYMPLSA